MPDAASAAMLSRRAQLSAAAGSGAARARRSTSVRDPRAQYSLTMQGGAVHTPCGNGWALNIGNLVCTNGGPAKFGPLFVQANAAACQQMAGQQG